MDALSLQIQEKLIENLKTVDPFAALKSAILSQVRLLVADRDYAIEVTRLIHETPEVRVFSTLNVLKQIEVLCGREGRS
jgi:hypothetical protein